MTPLPLLREFGSRLESTRARIGFGIALSAVMSTGLVLMVLSLVPLLGARGEVSYEIDATSLSIRPGSTLSAAPKVLALADLTRIRRVVAARGMREMGVGLPGYCVGRFRYEGLGSVWQATNCASDVLELEVRGEPLPIVLSPPDPCAFEAALRVKQPARVVASRVGTTNLFVPLGIGVAVLALGLGLILVLTLVAPHRIRCRVEAGGLEVRTMFLRKRWPTSGMRARLHRPRIGRKLMGTGMPGYRTGWFLVDGERTLVYATAQEGVLIEGPVRLFVTPEEPQAFLDSLRLAGAQIEVGGYADR